MKSRTKWATGGVVTAALILGGTLIANAAPQAGEPKSLPEGFTFQDGVRNEYRDTVSSFPYQLPKAIEFPPEVPLPVEDGVIYENGIGESGAYFFWQCAWMKSALDADEAADEAAVEAAFTELEKWDKTSFYRDHIIESYGTWKDAVLKPAEKKEFEPMAQSYSASCAGLTEPASNEGADR